MGKGKEKEKERPRWWATRFSKDAAILSRGFFSNSDNFFPSRFSAITPGSSPTYGGTPSRLRGAASSAMKRTPSLAVPGLRPRTGRGSIGISFSSKPFTITYHTCGRAVPVVLTLNLKCWFLAYSNTKYWIKNCNEDMKTKTKTYIGCLMNCQCNEFIVSYIIF